MSRKKKINYPIIINGVVFIAVTAVILQGLLLIFISTVIAYSIISILLLHNDS